MLGRILLAIAVTTGALGGSLAVASAQYPPPVGNCVVVASATATDEGGSVKLTITVRDLDGNVVAAEPVTLSVTAQPGGDATVAADATSTDANGVVTATLNVGTTPGVVEVTAVTADVSCRASVTVQGGEVEGIVELPETGTGPTESFGAEGVALLVLAVGSLLTSAGLRRLAR